MKWCFAVLMAVLWSIAAVAHAVVPESPQAMAATDDQATAARLVHGVLSDARYAYRPLALDDAASSQVFDAYVKALDERKLFLSDADLAPLQRYRSSLDDCIRRGDLEPALAIFAVLRASADARVAFAKTLLAEPLRFEGGGDWQPDRDRVERAADRDGLDALWRAMVRNDALELKLAGRTPAQASRLLETRYAAMAQRIAAITAAEVVETFLNAYAGSVDTGNAYYRPNKSMAWADLMAAGIGLSLVQRGLYPQVALIAPGGPAHADGRIAVGDRLLAVGDGDAEPEDVAGLSLDEIVRRLRGQEGTQVALQLLPAQGAARTIVLTRGNVQSRAEKSMLVVGARRIGVIRPYSFYLDFEGKREKRTDYTSVSRDVGRLIDALKDEGMDGLVIDLRGNEGGALTEVVELADLFLDHVPIVQIREGGGRVNIERDKPGQAWAGPLAVLVDGRTASGAEMFAAALQDHRRGWIVGQRTYGRGTIQNMLDLDRFPGNGQPQRFGMVKLTIAEAFRPNGDNFAPGVAPDIEFLAAPMAAKPARRIPPVDGVAHDPSPPAGLADLAAAHRARAAQPGDFQRWREGKLAEQAVLQRNRISLDEQARRVEMEAAGRSRDDDAAELREAAAVLADAAGLAQ